MVKLITYKQKNITYISFIEKVVGLITNKQRSITDTSSIEKIIKSQNGYAQISDTTWLVYTDLTASQLLNLIKPFNDGDVYVFEVSQQQFACNSQVDAITSWIINNMNGVKA